MPGRRASRFQPRTKDRKAVRMSWRHFEKRKLACGAKFKRLCNDLLFRRFLALMSCMAVSPRIQRLMAGC